MQVSHENLFAAIEDAAGTFHFARFNVTDRDQVLGAIDALDIKRVVFGKSTEPIDAAAEMAKFAPGQPYTEF